MKKTIYAIPSAFLLLASIATTTKAQNSVSLYSTISGTVWKENLPSDGIRQVTEDGIPGVLVTLMDAMSDKVISSAISGTDGSFTLRNYAGVGDYYIKYGYPEAGFGAVAKRVGADNLNNSAANQNTNSSDEFTISSNAPLNSYNLGLTPLVNKVTYCQTQSLSVTDWNTSFSFPKSNDAVAGTLSKVTLFIADAVWHPMIGVENTGAQGVSTTLGFSGLLTVTPPTGGASEITTTQLSKQVSLPVYDGVTDYGGTSGTTWHNEFSAIVNQNRTFTSNAQLNIFRGTTGMVTFPATAQNSFTITGGGNLENSVQTHVGAGVCLVYEYLPTVVLPITLVNYKATTDGASSFLTWETAMELGNTGFAIERSTDGKTFEEIGFVKTKAANKEGISNEKLAYAFTDVTPFTGQNFYRLKQVDFNNKFTYSPTQKVLIQKQNAFVVYPNPADQYVLISGQKESKLELYTLTGQLVPLNIEDAGAYSKRINISNLPTGNYTLVISSGNDTEVKKLSIKH